MKKLLLLPIILMAVILAGCSTGPRPWACSITKTTPASIQVDLIGVSAGDRAIWEGYNLDKYWSEGDRRRADADKITQTLKLGQAWRLEKTSPKWQQWFNQGATELLVIANLPGSFDPGPSDPRRIFLPLNKKAWKTKNDTIEIQVQDTMIHVLTPRRTP